MKSLFLEDNLNNFDSELQPYFLEESLRIGTGNMSIASEEEFVRVSNQVMKEMNILLKKIDNRYKMTDNKRKFITSLYRLNRKIKTREENMNTYYRRGEYASIIRYCVYWEDVKMLGTILEVPNLNSILKKIFYYLADIATSGGFSTGVAIGNLIVSRRLATTKVGIDQIKKYMNFLRNTSNYLEKTLYKYAPKDYRDFMMNT